MLIRSTSQRTRWLSAYERVAFCEDGLSMFILGCWGIDDQYHCHDSGRHVGSPLTSHFSRMSLYNCVHLKVHDLCSAETAERAEFESLIMYRKKANHQSWDAHPSDRGGAPFASEIGSSSMPIPSSPPPSLPSSRNEIPRTAIVDFPRLPPSTHYLLWNLGRRKRVRYLFILAKFEDDFSVSHEDELSACHVQASGKVADKACISCAAELGIFAECVFVSEYLGGSCAGCLYARRVCSIGCTSTFDMLLSKPSVLLTSKVWPGNLFLQGRRMTTTILKTCCCWTQLNHLKPPCAL